MAIPTSKYGSLDTYAKKTGSILEINSVLGGSKIEMLGFVTDFSQNFDSTWNQEEVYGRADPIATFQGTKRTISMSLSLAAASMEAAGRNFDNCRRMVQMMYPGYYSKTVDIADKYKVAAAQRNLQAAQSAQQTKKATAELRAALDKKQPKLVGRIISKAPLVRVKYANLIESSKNGGGGLLGYFTSVSWSPQVDMGYFTSQGSMFPKVINLSFTFNVLHEHSIGWENSKPYNGRFPF